jgi:hypothetical protein
MWMNQFSKLARSLLAGKSAMGIQAQDQEFSKIKLETSRFADTPRSTSACV